MRTPFVLNEAVAVAYDILKIQKLINDHKVPYSTFGISEKTMKKWIDGAVAPREDTIKRIADHFSISLRELRITEECSKFHATERNDNVQQDLSFVSNFLFLKEFDSELYLKGSTAEHHFINGLHNAEIYNDCINNINFVAKRIINILLRDMEISPPYGCNQYEKILHLKSYGEITDEEYEILDEIRDCRNWREHRSAKYNRAQTLLLLRKCFKMCCLLAVRYGIKCPQHFITPYETRTERSNYRPVDFKQKQKDAILSGNYNEVMIYSMVLRDGFTVEKYMSFCAKWPYQSLANLYLHLRRKRTVFAVDDYSYTKLREALSDSYSFEVLDELDSVFIPEYRATLNSLVEKIHQTVGEF